MLVILQIWYEILLFISWVFFVIHLFFLSLKKLLYKSYVQMGTGFSILISKRNPSLVTTFGLLSCGYLLSSYQEVQCSFKYSIPVCFIVFLLTWLVPFQVRSVVLHTLNRARFTVAVESFIKTGK